MRVIYSFIGNTGLEVQVVHRGQRYFVEWRSNSNNNFSIKEKYWNQPGPAIKHCLIMAKHSKHIHFN